MKTTPKVISITTKQHSNLDLLSSFYSQGEEIKYLASILTYQNRKIQVVVSNSKVELVAIRNIVYLKSSSNYCQLHLKNGRVLTTSKTLKYWCEIISDEYFLRCHNSFCVNKTFIESYNSNESILEMKGKISVPVSRNVKGEILRLIMY